MVQVREKGLLALRSCVAKLELNHHNVTNNRAVGDDGMEQLTASFICKASPSGQIKTEKISIVSRYSIIFSTEVKPTRLNDSGQFGETTLFL